MRRHSDMSSVSINPIQALHICNLAGPDVVHHRDGKFSSGMHVFCPYIHCNFKNSQFQTTGKFPAEFMLNHLHSNHKHRRYDGESLDMTMVVPQVEVCRPMSERRGAICNPSQPQQATLQTWPFVEVVAYKRYFYLEAQSFNDSEGHPEVFIWLWFFGQVAEEANFRYSLSVTHGKSEYSYKGPVVSLQKSYTDVKNDGRCLVIREQVWDYMSYKLKITKTRAVIEEK